MQYTPSYLFGHIPAYIFPAWPYILLYVVDIIVILAGFRFIARRTFIYSIPIYRFAFMAFSSVLLYPSDRSEINILSTGEFFYRQYMKAIDPAFVLTSIGLGIFLATVVLGSRFKAEVSMGFIGRSVRTFIFSDNLAYLLIVIELTLLLVMIAAGVKLFSARSSGFIDPKIRPVILVSTYMGTFCLSIFFARLFYSLSLKNIVFILFSGLFTLTLGSRGALLGPLLFYIIYNSWWHKERNVVKYVVLLVILLFAVQALNELRGGGGDSSSNADSFAATIFYGNAFSDLRDFAWILSGFGSAFLLGKTYLAGILGFVPSFLFPLRQQWNIGPTTLALSGFINNDPTHKHPGLRGTFVTEAYLNFGYIGIIAIAILLGLFLLYDYRGINKAIQRKDKADFIVRLVRYEFVNAMIYGFSNTSSFSDTYFLFGMLAVAGFLKRAS
jgi:hypothetical protein